MKKILLALTALFISIALLSGCNDITKPITDAIGEKISAIAPTERYDYAYEVETELQGRTCYYYNKLNDEQKTAYRRLYKAIKNFEEKCALKVEEPELSDIWTAVSYDNPEMFWASYEYKYLDYGNKIEISLEYVMAREEAERISADFENKVAEILNEASKYETAYEKELFFHDYICLNCVYDKETFGNIGNTAYSVLLNGKSICEGYSKAMQLLLNRAGITNYLVVGNGTSDGTTEAHMWNIVELDGKKYHVDTTWDDYDNEEKLGHLYFNMTDEDILFDHSDLEPADNGCTFKDDSYFNKTGTYVTEFKNYRQLSAPCAELIKNGIYYAEIRFENDADYKKALNIIEKDDAFFSFVREVAKKTGWKIKSDEIAYIDDEDHNYIRISFLKN